MRSRKAPKVSIGMPVYNGQKFIAETLDALLAQSFLDFELIISDNASTDGTEGICRGYAARDPRIRYMRHFENRGAFANFKFVLDAAEGRYFMWAAADDCLCPDDGLKNLVDRIDKGYAYVFPDVDIVFDDLRPKVKNVMRQFNHSVTRLDFARGSVAINSFQFYGLFDLAVLRDYWIYIAKCSDLKCFGEGLFVHAISALLDGAYVRNAKLEYRRHAENISSATPASLLIVDFIKYSKRSLAFFISVNTLGILDKLRILNSMFVRHGKYLAYLVGATAKQWICAHSSLKYLSDKCR